MAAKKREFVGVYITATRIEAAYFEDEEDEHPRLSAQGSIEIPDGVFNEEGDIVEVDQLADLMKELWSEAEFKVWKAVIVLASKKAIVRQLRLPHMPLAALHQTVLSEAEQFALFRKEEPMVDHFTTDPDGEFITVCFGAISTEVVRQYHEVCQAAGIKLHSVDLVQLAGQRGISYWYPPEEDYWTGVMVLAQRIIVSFWKDAKLQNIREILLPDRERISMEALAQNYIPEITRTIASDAEFYDDPHLVLGCEEIQDAYELAGHIQSGLNFEAKVAGPDPAVLAAMPQKNKKKAKSDDDDDDDDDEDDDDEVPSVISVSYIAVGAALWGTKGAVSSFNLVKFAGGRARGPFKIETLQRFFKNVPPVPVIGIVAALLISLGLMLGWRTVRMQAVNQLNQEISRVKGDLQAQEARQQKLKPEESILRQWVPNSRENSFAKDFAGKLRDIIPSDAWVSQIEYTSGNEMTLYGAAMNQTSCLYFADEIGTLPDIDNVKITGISKKGRVFVFEIHAGLLQGARP